MYPISREINNNYYKSEDVVVPAGYPSLSTGIKSMLSVAFGNETAIESLSMCSEVDCAIRCNKSATCNATQYMMATGNCTLFSASLVPLYYNLNSKAWVRPGGEFFTLF